jgi:hypothetical protein
VKNCLFYLKEKSLGDLKKEVWKKKSTKTFKFFSIQEFEKGQLS